MDETRRPFDRALADRYAVERTLGQGGMGSVYLADDLKHHRKVAVKVLRPEVAAALGAERFLREIEIAAKLNHPHILALYDSGTADGFLFFVMPYITGDSLRQKLEREGQLSVEEALRITTQVASALDYAHAQGLLHRDIKPENILLHEREALVADFGIALAMSAAATERLTATGVWLGTPAYTSPEQATGERTLDARSDVYSLGCVCYEMLAGEPPYAGKGQALMVKHAVDPVPAVRRLRTAIPAGVEQALQRTLAKAPADRFASAGEFAEALAKAVADGPRRQPAAVRPLLNYALIALAILMAGAAIWGWIRPGPSKSVVRYTLVVDSTQALANTGTSWSGRIALSPDGSHLAYIGPRSQLLIRPRNQLRATALPGTQGANTPFFSPDGNRVGFLREEQVQIASMTGGPPITVTDTLTGVSGASWGPDGFIYLDGSGFTSLLRVEAKPGARPRWFTALDTARGEIDHTWPEVLPNGKGVLFTVVFRRRTGAQGRTSYAIAVADIPSGKHRVIVDDATYARYATSGHLLYVTTNKALMVVPFDENSMEVRGEPAALTEGMRLGILGSADLAVSATGTLVYATGAGRGDHELVWVTRDGKVQAVDPNWQGGFVGFPALSPDGKALAVARGANTEFTNIWIKRMDRGPGLKLTLHGENHVCPAWTPDGRSLTFSSEVPGGGADLWSQPADGSGQAVLQVHEKRNLYAAIWSPNGKWLIFHTGPDQPGAGDILAIRPGIDSVPVPVVVTKFTEISPALSPDGRWLAYASNETGEDEIYVVPFPNTGTAKWAISTSGGTEPLWSHRGNELFYRDASENLVAVEVKTKPTFSVGHSTALFRAMGFFAFRFDAQYAVAPDDQRFLMIRPVAAGTPDQIVVVENWFEELRSRARN